MFTKLLMKMALDGIRPWIAFPDLVSHNQHTNEKKNSPTKDFNPPQSFTRKDESKSSSKDGNFVWNLKMIPCTTQIYLTF